MPPHVADAVVDILATTEGGAITATARQVLGRDPLPFTQWAREHAADFH